MPVFWGNRSGLRGRLFLLSLFRQPDSRAFYLLADARDFLRVAVGLRAGLEHLQRCLPLRNGVLSLAQLEVDIAQVIVHRGVLADAVERLQQQPFGQDATVPRSE